MRNAPGLVGDSRLSTTDIADLLGIKPASLRQLLTRGGFPPPTHTEGRANLWLASTVFNYALIHRPDLHQRIPRLYPRIPSPNPAAYLGARSVTIGGPWRREYIAHVWRPSDGGGEVALAYTITTNTSPPSDTEALLTALDVTAVVVPSDHLDGDCGYLDRSTPVLETVPTWADLRNLLQIDIPWWPVPLRRRDVMLQWLPGCDPTPVVPHSANANQDPSTLLRLAATTHLTSAATEPVVNEFFSTWATHIALATHRSANPTGAQNEAPPGLSVPVYGVSPGPDSIALTELADQDEPPLPGPDTVAAILHAQAAPREYADAAAIFDNFTIWDPWIVGVHEISTSTVDPQLKGWLDRLIPDTGPHPPGSPVELGHLYLTEYARERRRHSRPWGDCPPSYLIDPQNPHCWIVHFTDTIYATMSHRNA